MDDNMQNIAKTITDNRELRHLKKALRVLVIEDDLTLQPIWEYVFSKLAKVYRADFVESARDAELALVSLKDKGLEYDLVIADIYLSGPVTGLDFWHRHSESLRGKIILVSSIDNVKFLRFTGGAVSKPVYIRKPLNIEDCIETLYCMLLNQNQ